MRDMADLPGEVDVLVVGAGPTGLSLACTLARYGVRCLIIDQSKGPSEVTKASLMNPRTQEVLQRLGALDEALAVGLKAYGTTVYAEGKRLAHFSFESVDSPFAYALNIGQPHTEKVLIDLLERSGNSVVRRTRLDGWEEDEDEIQATLTDSDGAPQTVRAKYLVGCDGARSLVREKLGLVLEGKTYCVDTVIGDVRLDWEFPRDEELLSFEREGVLVVYPMPDGRHLVSAELPMLPSNTFRRDEGMVPTLEDLQTVFDARSPFPGRLSDPRWMTYYSVHQRATRTMRRGRVFLAGDAVQLSSPMGGLGMNTGIQDGFNLGWLLGYTLHGWAGEKILDSYEPERLIAMDLRADVSDSSEKLFMERSHVKQHLRNTIYRTLAQSDGAMTSMMNKNFQLKLAFRKSPAVGEFAGQPIHFSGEHLTDKGLCMEAWLHFGQGPHGGDRAPDVRLKTPGAERVHLYKVCSHPFHELLLFTGSEDPKPETIQRLKDVIDFVSEQFSEWIQMHLLVADDVNRTGIEDERAPVLLDHEKRAHDQYGACGACLYLIRPDGCVGFRSLPPDVDQLAAYVRRVFGKGEEAFDVERARIRQLRNKLRPHLIREPDEQSLRRAKEHGRE